MGVGRALLHRRRLLRPVLGKPGRLHGPRRAGVLPELGCVHALLPGLLVRPRARPDRRVHRRARGRGQLQRLHRVLRWPAAAHDERRRHVQLLVPLAQRHRPARPRLPPAVPVGRDGLQRADADPSVVRRHRRGRRHRPPRPGRQRFGRRGEPGRGDRGVHAHLDRRAGRAGQHLEGDRLRPAREHQRDRRVDDPDRPHAARSLLGDAAGRGGRRGDLDAQAPLGDRDGHTNGRSALPRVRGRGVQHRPVPRRRLVHARPARPVLLGAGHSDGRRPALLQRGRSRRSALGAHLHERPLLRRRHAAPGRFLAELAA